MTEYCEPFSTPCRFCSKEHMLIPFAKLVENPKTNRLEPAKETLLRTEALGTWCNNRSQWTRDVTQCPARVALATRHGFVWAHKADGTGTYAKLIGSMEMKALMAERVPGQQVLGV